MGSRIVVSYRSRETGRRRPLAVAQKTPRSTNHCYPTRTTGVSSGRCSRAGTAWSRGHFALRYFGQAVPRPALEPGSPGASHLARQFGVEPYRNSPTMRGERRQQRGRRWGVREGREGNRKEEEKRRQAGFLSLAPRPIASSLADGLDDDIQKCPQRTDHWWTPLAPTSAPHARLPIPLVRLLRARFKYLDGQPGQRILLGGNAGRLVD
ncbi:hypothetical protein CMUS01_09989 [Colletotrichum musicola]|uniref:Uncharacterized protein n=1 Tax=Colletotrichum musicola TaxID=2175873 RepID=A0A8H6N9D3_9PEZI|nr:hypothetical protein CMUS01_09989 [Colletotrichum musicola]